MDDLTVKETAEFLRVSEKTIYRWVRQGVIPSFKFQGHYRFDRRELETWARYNRIGNSASLPQVLETENNVSLFDALQKGGVFYKVEGNTPEEIYNKMIHFFPFGPQIPPERQEILISELIERENLVSTGIGEGFAIPHPRHPRDWGLGGPSVSLFFLENPVDYKCFDHHPVNVLFLVLCTTIKGHLRMLSQITHLLKNPETRDFLATTPNRTELLEKIQHALS